MTAVQSFVRRKPWDKTVLLGDIVGYCANPNPANCRPFPCTAASKQCAPSVRQS